LHISKGTFLKGRAPDAKDTFWMFVTQTLSYHTGTPASLPLLGMNGEGTDLFCVRIALLAVPLSSLFF
jgi:hypothetical protein